MVRSTKPKQLGRFLVGPESLEERLVMDYGISFAGDVLTITSSTGDVSDLSVIYGLGSLVLTENGAAAGSFVGAGLPTGVSILTPTQLSITDAFFSNANRAVSIDLGDGADRVTILGIAGTRSGVNIDMGIGSDSLVGSAQADVISIQGNESVGIGGLVFQDVETVDAGTQPLNEGDRVVGQAAGDLFVLNGANSLTSSGVRFNEIEIVDGAGGGDTVHGTAGDDVVTLVAPTAGFPSSTNVFVGSVLFGNVENVEGGGGVDNLGGVDSGAGSDETVNLSSTAGVFTVAGLSVSGFARFDARGGNDRIVGTSGDDTFQMVSANSLTASGVIFAGIETVQGGNGTDVVLGVPLTDDTFLLTGDNTGRTLGVQFEEIDNYNARTGAVNLSLDPGLVGTTTLVFTGLTSTPNSVRIRNILFEIVREIDTNGEPVQQVDLPSIRVADLDPSAAEDFQPIANDIVLRELTTINVDTVVGTTGSDAFLLTGAGTLSFRGVNYTAVREFDGAGGRDQVNINSGGSIVDVTFRSTDSNNFLHNLAGTNIDVRNIEVVNPDTRDIRLISPQTVAPSPVSGQQLTANGIDFTRVIEVQNAATLQGTTGNDSIILTSPTQLIVAGVVYTNLGTYDGLGGTDQVTFDIVPVPNYVFDFPTQNITNNTLTAFGITYRNIEIVSTLGSPVSLTNVNLLTRIGNRSFTANSISFSNVSSATTNALVGTSGNDDFFLNLNGTVAFSQNPGNDTVVTLQGNRLVLGGGGDDRAFGPASSGSEVYRLSSIGTDATVRAPGGFELAGIDTIQSANANETLFGTNGDDGFLINGANTLQISRSQSFPFSTAFQGFSTIDGLEGNDTFAFGNEGSWSGTLLGGAGNDLLQGDANGSTFVINGVTGSRINDQVGPNGSQVPQLGGVFTQFETVQGGAGDDIFLYQGGAFTSIVIDGGNQTTASNAINNTNRGDIADFSAVNQPITVNFDGASVLVGLSDSFGMRNVETVIGTNQADRFVRAQASAQRVIDGRGGADLFQVGNNSPDVIIYDGLDQLFSFDQTLDTLIPTVPGTPAPPVGVYNPITLPTGLNNIWQTLQLGQANGFISNSNFPLVAEAYVRYLYRFFIGGDPDSANGQRIVAFWTQRVTSQSLTSLDLVTAFLTQNVANIGGNNPPPAQYFADYFFNGFAQREFGNPYAGKDTTQLANLVKSGMSLEAAARAGGFLVTDTTLARGWAREVLFNVQSKQQSEALFADPSRALLATAPSSTTFNLMTNAIITLVRRQQRPWLNALQTIVNSAEGLRSAIRTAAVENPTRYASLMIDSTLPNIKLGSFEAQGWFLDNPPGRSRELSGSTGVDFGVVSDIPVPGDYTGDNRDDFAVFRQGNWFIDTNGTVGFQGNDTSIQFGVAGDIPTPGDWDANGTTNLGVFRNGTWFLDSNGTRGWQGTDTAISFGVAGDIPVVGDWNGDGLTDLGVRRGNVFYLDTNGVRGWQGNDTTVVDTFGPGRVVVYDFNADGRDDIAVVDGTRWRIDYNGPFGFQPGIDAEIFFDTNGGVPVVMSTSPVTLNRLVAGPPASSSASLFAGPILFNTSSTNSQTSTTNSTVSNGSGSSTNSSTTESNSSVGQTMLLGRSRTAFGTGSGSSVMTVDEALESPEAWLWAEASEEAVDEVLSEA
jgi:hypothetical protein